MSDPSRMGGKLQSRVVPLIQIFRGTVVAEIKKNALGEVDLTYRSGNYLTYILDLPSSANVACGSLP